MTGSDNDEAKVDEILFACLDRPEPAWEGAVDESCREHPGLADEIRARFETLRSFGMTTGESPTLTRIGDYELLHPIGGGTMGTVFLARRASSPGIGGGSGAEPNVAVKILRSGLHLSAPARRRFAREREIAAKLEHPGICAVTDAGEVDGVPFLAMEFIDGGSLTDRIARQLTQGSSLDAASVNETLTLIEGVARALDAAHRAGLVHRDIKPGNIVIRGNGQPVLLDFGLARDLRDEGLKLTVSGTLLGSPAYLAPEVISGGESGDVRSDIYSLGVTLYEALTLRLPYIAPTREALFHRILHDPFPDPRRRHPAIDRQLVAVLRTVLARSPNRRYSTALALAEDLARVREGQRVSVRYPGTISRCAAWARRKPLAASFVAVILLALVTTTFLLREVWGGLNRMRALGLASVSGSVDPELGVLLARHAVELLEDPATVSQLHAAVARFHHPVLYPQSDGEVIACQFRPGGRGVVCVSAEKQLQIFGANRELEGRFEDVLEALPGPLADQVLMRYRGGAYLWTLGQELKRIGAGEALAIQVDGAETSVVTRESEGQLFLHRSREKEPTALGDGTDCGGVLIARNGRFVFVLSGRSVTCFDATGRPLVTAPAEKLLAVSNDGLSAVVESGEHLVWYRLVSPQGDARAIPRHETVATLPVVSSRCVFSPDDQRLAVLESPATLRVYDARGGLVFTVPPRGNILHDVVFSPNGRFIATGDGGAVARLVHAQDGTEAAVLRGHAGHVRCVAFRPDGKRVATGSHDHRLRVFRVQPGVDHRFAVEDYQVVGVDALGGQKLAVGGRGDVWLWPGNERVAVRAKCATFLAGGHLAVGGMDGRCRVLDAAGAELALLTELPAKEPIVRLTTDPGREQLVGFTSKGLVVAWKRDGKEWREVARFETGHTLWSADVSGDGRIVCAAKDGRVHLFARDGGRIESFQAHDDVIWSVRFSPEDDAILTASRDNRARLWSTGGELLVEFLDHEKSVHGAVFSPDGETIATVSTDETVRIWDRGGRARSVLTGHGGQVLDAVFTPDGEYVISGAFDRCMRVWPVRTQRLLELSRELVDRPFTDAELERFGEYLARQRK